MYVHVPSKLMPLFERPMTQSETETLRRSVFIIWQSLVLIATLGSLVFLWYHRTIFAAVPILPVSLLVTYRIYRLEPRRCPHCSGKQDAPSKTLWGKVRHFLKRIFGGWFVRRNYWRELFEPDMTKYAVRKPLWWEEIPSQKVEDPFAEKHWCHFHYTCVCKFDYPVKERELRSFGNRVPFFHRW